MQLNDTADWKIINVQIEGEYQLMDDTFSMKGTNSDVMIPFESHIERVQELINKVEEGKEIKDSELKGLNHYIRGALSSSFVVLFFYNNGIIRVLNWR